MAVFLILALLVAPGLAAPAGPAEPSLLETRPAQPGSLCSLCGEPLGADDVAHRIRGRWIPVHAGPCEGTLREDPRAALSAYQPKGALFQEAAEEPPGLPWAWFAGGLYILIGLAGAALCAHLAYPRRRSPLLWAGLGFVFNVAAVAALLGAARPAEQVPPRLGRIHDTAEPVPCPACGSENHPAAARCPACGAALAPALVSEARRALT
jgi:hypothetical protein